jgi:hypothetical protein
LANGGWYGTAEEWDRLEAPIKALDPAIHAFAIAHSLSVDRNEKESVGRSIRWGSNPSCLIQLYLADQAALTWNLWACCSEDRQMDRYWKTRFLIEGQSVTDFAQKIQALLLEAYYDLMTWSAEPEQLVFATKLSPLPKL